MEKKLIVKQLQNCADMFNGVFLIASKGYNEESASIKAITLNALNKLTECIEALESKEAE